MDQLKTLLSTLDENDLSLFKQVLKSKTNRKDQKALSLVEYLLADKETSEEYIERIYGDRTKKNNDAFHASRRRFGDWIRSYIAQKEDQREGELMQEVNNWFASGKHLIFQQYYSLGWRYLAKAEKLAIQFDLLEKLHTIYNFYIEHAAKPEAPLLHEVELKRATNKTKIDFHERINMAASLIQLKLKAVKLNAKEIDMMALLSDTLERYQLEDALDNNPKALLKFARIIRSAYLADKDYYAMQPHLESLNEMLSQAESTQNKHLLEALELKYMLSHAYYRNKRFDKSFALLQKLIEGLKTLPLSKRKELTIKSTMLLAAVESFRNQNSHAVEILEQFKSHPFFNEANENRANLHLNLAVYYFQQARFKDANRILQHFPNSDKWCQEHLGVEWSFKKDLVDMIVQYELGNIEIALARHRSISKRFSKMLNLEKYERARLFLRAARQYIMDQEKFLASSHFDTMRNELVKVTWKQEDLQAMTYYSWLKSKKEGLPYYEVLLDTVGKPEADPKVLSLDRKG